MSNLTERLAEMNQMLNGHRVWCITNQPGTHMCNCDAAKEAEK